jgi:hypothetical protein
MQPGGSHEIEIIDRQSPGPLMLPMSGPESRNLRLHDPLTDIQVSDHWPDGSEKTTPGSEYTAVSLPDWRRHGGSSPNTVNFQYVLSHESNKSDGENKTSPSNENLGFQRFQRASQMSESFEKAVQRKSPLAADIEKAYVAVRLQLPKIDEGYTETFIWILRESCRRIGMSLHTIDSTKFELRSQSSSTTQILGHGSGDDRSGEGDQRYV